MIYLYIILINYNYNYIIIFKGKLFELFISKGYKKEDKEIRNDLIVVSCLLRYNNNIYIKNYK